MDAPQYGHWCRSRSTESPQSGHWGRRRRLKPTTATTTASTSHNTEPIHT